MHMLNHEKKKKKKVSDEPPPDGNHRKPRKEIKEIKKDHDKTPSMLFIRPFKPCGQRRTT
jgi:hypothetical protein